MQITRRVAHYLKKVSEVNLACKLVTHSLNDIVFLTGNTTIKVLDDDEIESMRVSCKLGREVLDEAAKAIAVGVTTDEIDRVVHEAAIERDCYPSPLNYYNFPKSCCTSVNEVICHGIPDLRPLEVIFVTITSETY